MEKKDSSQSARAGLQYMVERFGEGAPVYLPAMMEYLAGEVLELAGNAARDNKKDSDYSAASVIGYSELNKLLSGVTIAQGRKYCRTSSDAVAQDGGEEGSRIRQSSQR